MAVEKLHERLLNLHQSIHTAADGYDRVVEAHPAPAAAARPSPVYTCEAGPVPVLVEITRFGQYVSPEYWPKYASAIDIEVMERVPVPPAGWKGVVDETVKPLKGDGPLASLLSLRNHLDVEFVGVDSEAGDACAQVSFSLRESLDGVLDRDQGYMRAVAWDELFLHWTHISAQKSLQLRRAPPPWFEHMIPDLLKAILDFWLWEYAIRFMLDPPRDAPSHHNVAGTAATSWLEQEFRRFEKAFEGTLKGVERAVEGQASAAR